MRDDRGLEGDNGEVVLEGLLDVGGDGEDTLAELFHLGWVWVMSLLKG